jgi:hypothetical protein
MTAVWGSNRSLRDADYLLKYENVTLLDAEQLTSTCRLALILQML